jgi:hypothetical protein
MGRLFFPFFPTEIYHMEMPKINPNRAKDMAPAVTDFARYFTNIRFHNSNPFYKKFSN